MNDEQCKKLMSDEISGKINSGAWDLEIACCVLARKRKSRRAIFLSGFAALSAAAAVIVVFLFGIKTETNMAGYEGFITQQVAGAGYSIAGSKLPLPENRAGIQEIVLQNDTDAMIDETLAMR